MNLEYFNSFIETAHEKSMSKASQKINISHQALSKQIRILEEHYGVPLFKRSASGVELTKAGILLYTRLQPLLEEYSSIEKDLKKLKALQTYRLGTLPSLAGSYIPPKILNAKKEGIELEIVIKNTSPDLAVLLEKGELDAAILEGVHFHNSFWHTKLYNEALYAILPVGHKFSGYPSLLLEEISEEPFVLYPPKCGIRKCVAGILNEAGKQLTVATEIEFSEHLIGYVAAGAGITVVPENTVRHLGNPKVRVIPLSNTNAVRTISLVSVSEITGKLLYKFFKQGNNK